MNVLYGMNQNIDELMGEIDSFKDEMVLKCGLLVISLSSLAIVAGS